MPIGKKNDIWASNPTILIIVCGSIFASPSTILMASCDIMNN